MGGKMRTKKNFLVTASFVFLCLTVLGLGACQQSTAAVSPSIGKAPDFTLPDLDGKPFSLSSTAGKVVLLDFWATWCPPCRMGVPELQELYDRYKAKGLVIVGVSLDQGGAADVRPFVKANGVTYPIVIGDQRVANLYGGIRGIPTMFVVDRGGNVVKKLVGYQQKSVLEAVVKELL